MTSSKEDKKPRLPFETRNVKFSDGTVVNMNHTHAKSLNTRPVSGIHKIPPEKLSTELPQAMELEKDKFDDLEYPPPSRNKAFREIWAQGIKNISSRENFDPSHLSLYETYCHLIVNMRRLDDFINTHGQTFRVITSTGEVRRTHPEVLERNKTVAQIAMYSKLLDLLPKKDKMRAVKKNEKEDWS